MEMPKQNSTYLRGRAGRNNIVERFYLVEVPVMIALVNLALLFHADTLRGQSPTLCGKVSQTIGA
ncbi:MAG TPA: hypothetical protein VHT24_12905 [Pseudacidobacterium sp.]|jgi:hypothetical protein|nr:hypothetical protein [Pseudacidobacterium sp.]